MGNEVKLTSAEFDMLLNTWDRVRSAINSISVSQPHQMTEASQRLQHEREAMDAFIKVLGRATLTGKDEQ